MLDANRVFRGFRDIKVVFRAGFCATIPGLSHAKSKAYEFLYSIRAIRARETSGRSNPAGRNFDEPIPEGSIYAAPQSIGMFAMEGRTITFVKDQGARGGAIIGADVFPPARSIKEKHAVLSSIKTSNHDWVAPICSIRLGISK
jgi:hypothetical protein